MAQSLFSLNVFFFIHIHQDISTIWHRINCIVLCSLSPSLPLQLLFLDDPSVIWNRLLRQFHSSNNTTRADIVYAAIFRAISPRESQTHTHTGESIFAGMFGNGCNKINCRNDEKNGFGFG